MNPVVSRQPMRLVLAADPNPDVGRAVPVLVIDREAIGMLGRALVPVKVTVGIGCASEDLQSETNIPSHGSLIIPMSTPRVRRAKAALSSGCKPHPAKCSSRKQPEQSWR